MYGVDREESVLKKVNLNLNFTSFYFALKG